MTDEEVKSGFDEVYNQFWLGYRGLRIKHEHEEEWNRMNTWAVVLMKKYPFMSTVIGEMVAELNHRALIREGIIHG